MARCRLQGRARDPCAFRKRRLPSQSRSSAAFGEGELGSQVCGMEVRFSRVSARGAPPWTTARAPSQPAPRRGPLAAGRPGVHGRRWLDQQHVDVVLRHWAVFDAFGTRHGSRGPSSTTRSRNSRRRWPDSTRKAHPSPDGRARQGGLLASPGGRRSRSGRPRCGGGPGLGKGSQLLVQVDSFAHSRKHGAPVDAASTPGPVLLPLQRHGNGTWAPWRRGAP